MKKYLLFTIILLTIPFCLQAQINVALTWSTDTYVPASYRGKPLPTRDSDIEVVANIDSSAQNINLEEYIFNWYLNDFIQDQSGKGKQTFRFNVGTNIYQKHSVKVEIKDEKGIPLAESQRLIIKMIEPEIVISPLKRGIDISQEQYQVPADQEIKFIARPYFFNIENLDDLEYNWSFGQEKLPQKETKNPNIFALKIGEIAKIINQSLNLFVENKSNFIQRARNKIGLILNP